MQLLLWVIYCWLSNSPVVKVLAVCSRVPADWQKVAPALSNPPRTDMAHRSYNISTDHNLRLKRAQIKYGKAAIRDC